MNFLHSEPILIGVYVCCLWGVGKVPISTNRNTSGPQPRWLRRCTNILEIHQTRKTNRNAPRKLETHHQSPHQSSIHGCKNKFYWLQKFCFTSFQKQDISATIQALIFVPPFKISASHCFRARTCCYSICSNKLLLIANSAQTESCSTFLCVSVRHRRDISSFLDNLTV